MTDDISLEYVQKTDSFNLKNNCLLEDDFNPLYNNTNHVCKYYNEIECLNKFDQINNATFSILSSNIRSLPRKFSELKDFLTSSFGKVHPDIICLQEVWNIPIHDNFLLNGYHPIEYKIRDPTNSNSNIGGGIGCYIRNHLSFEPLPELSVFIPRVFESQFFKIKHGKNKFSLIGNIYRPNTMPFANIKRFNTILLEIFEKIKSNVELKNIKDVIICGDMNIDLLKSYSHLDSGTYLETLLQFGLLQLITLPTRLGNRSATILDHIATNFSDDNFDTGIITSDISDHFPVFYVRHLANPKKEKVLPVKIRKIDDNSKRNFYELLANRDWNDILNNYTKELCYINILEDMIKLELDISKKNKVNNYQNIVF